MIDVLRHLQEGFGPAPRPVPYAFQAAYDGPWPEWVHDDPLKRTLDALEGIVSRGQVGLGAVVIANDLLWRAGEVPAPGALAVTTDPSLWHRPTALVRIADRILAHRRDRETSDLPKPGWTPLRQRLMDDISDDYLRMGRRVVSRDVTGGHEVRLETVMFHPAWLPSRRIAGALLPVMVSGPDSGVRGVLVIPSVFWPAGLVRAWTDAAPAPGSD